MVKKTLKLSMLILLLSITVTTVTATTKKNISEYITKAGKEITILLDLDKKYNPSYNYSATINYNENDLEFLNEDSFLKEYKDSSQKITYNGLENKIMVTNYENSKKDQLKIKLKVKKDIKNSQTTIYLNKITATNGKQKINLPAQKINIKITDSNIKLAQRKTNYVRIMLIALVIIAGIILLYYNIHHQIPDTVASWKIKKKINIILSSTIALLIVATILSYISNQTKENNVEYLLKIKNQKEVSSKISKTLETKENQPVYELPSYLQKTATITNQLNSQINNSSNQQTYTKIVKSEVSNPYPEKGEPITIYYTIDYLSKEEIKSVIINHQIYEVKKVNEKIYKINYQPIYKFGTHPLQITKINYSTYSVPVNDILYVDILKSKPTISLLEYDETKENPIVNVQISDQDNALITSNLIVTDESANEVFQTEITPNQTDYNLKIQANGTYNIAIEATYDLDSNHSDFQNQITSILKCKTVDIIVDYNLTLDNVKVKSTNQSNKTVDIEFNSTNNSNYNIEKISVNNQIYPVEKVGEKYLLQIPVENFQTKTLTLHQVILENGKHLTVNQTIKIFKNAPQLTNISTTTNEANNQINVTYDVLDQDQTIQKLLIILNDIEGNTVIKQLDPNEHIIYFPIQKYGEYSIQVLADYDLNDGQEYTNQILISNHKVIVPPTTIITLDTTKTNLYPKKGEILNLYYKIEDNTNKQITNIILNGIPYPVQKQEDTYQISYQVKNTAGVEILNLTKIIYQDQTSSSVDQTDKIEVLKSIPTITNYQVTENEQENQTTFSFHIVDPDNALIRDESGEFIDTYASIMDQKIAIKNNLESIQVTFSNLPKDKPLTFFVHATFDLDTNELNTITGKEQNYQSEYPIYQITYPEEFNLATIQIQNTTDFEPIMAKEEEDSSKIEIMELSPFIENNSNQTEMVKTDQNLPLSTNVNINSTLPKQTEVSEQIQTKDSNLITTTPKPNQEIKSFRNIPMNSVKIMTNPNSKIIHFSTKRITLSIMGNLKITTNQLFSKTVEPLMILPSINMHLMNNQKSKSTGVFHNNIFLEQSSIIF